MINLILINSIILTVLSVLHVHWAFGGKLGWGAAVPTRQNGQRLFNPGIRSSLVVAFGLLIFALIAVGNSGIFSAYLDMKYFQIGNWVVASVFLLRAFGDFNYIGFTKKIKSTPFGINDTRFYSPLCLFIATISILITFLR